jgi:hypothetical protein
VWGVAVVRSVRVRRLRVRACLAAAAVAVALPQLAGTAQADTFAGHAFTNGAVYSGNGYTCGDLYTSPQQIVDSSGYVGQEVVVGGSPVAGDTFYYRIIFGSPAPDACGSYYAVPEITLPPNHQLAISATSKVRCFSGHISPGNDWTETVSDCPQTAKTGTHHTGSLSFAPNVDPYSFPVPPNGIWQLWIPMKATGPTPANAAFNAHIRRLSGSATSEWLELTMPIYVAPLPSVTYTQPSASQITATSARTTGRVNNNYTTGDAYFDFGTTTSYGQVSGPIQLPANSQAYDVWEDWPGLVSGKTYHWRMRYVRGGQVTYVGADQTFTTLDNVAPVAKPAITSLTRGATLGTSTVPVLVSWSATDNAAQSGLHYDVLQRDVTANGAWTPVLTGTAAKSTTRQLTANHTYQFRVRAKDAAGNISDYVDGAALKPALSQEAAASWSGSWTRVASSGASGGYVRTSKTANAKGTFTARGRTLAVVAPLRSDLGSIKVCATRSGTTTASCSSVDLSPASGLGSRRLVHTRALNPAYSYRIDVFNTSGRADVDAFVVLS